MKINKIFSTAEIQKLKKLAKQAQPKQTKATKKDSNKESNSVPIHYVR